MTRRLILLIADADTGEVMAGKEGVGNILKRHELHDWTGEGERCKNCGDKDWMNDPLCISRVDLSGAEVKLPKRDGRSCEFGEGYDQCLTDFQAQMKRE